MKTRKGIQRTLKGVPSWVLAMFTGFAVMSVPPAFAENASGLGNVDFKTSCAPEANAAFNRGLGLLHHMMYFQADAHFSKAAEKSPNCAMLQWGIAMSKFHPLWPGKPSDAAIAAGKEAADRMNALPEEPGVEAAFRQAVSAFYEGEGMGYRDRVKAWAVAQGKVHDQFPDHVDATAFKALALLASAPRGDKTYANQREAGALMVALNDRTELHPGVYHYAIHAYDNPMLYEKGLPFAEEYGLIAPDMAHALHMPSHIFVRAGVWDQVIAWNEKSANAALEAPLGDLISSHYAHAMDYLIYAHLQRGDFDTAGRLLAEFEERSNHQSNFGSAYALAASPVRAALEQSQWAKLATMTADMHTSISWEKFPQTVSIRWFAIGLGAARSGDLERAGAALEELTAIRTRLKEAKIGYWLKLTEVQMLTIKAWMEHARGNAAMAISLLTKAADMEDAAGKSPVTPGHVLPARELLGDLLADLGETETAGTAYRATLALAPNRLRSRQALQ